MFDILNTTGSRQCTKQNPYCAQGFYVILFMQLDQSLLFVIYGD